MLTRILRSTYGRPFHWRFLARSSRSQLSTSTGTSATSSTAARRRALALLLVGGGSASYHLREKRSVQCDSSQGASWVHGLGSKEDMERALKRNSETYVPNSSSGFSRFDFAQLGR
jgi:hypothetical protein